MCVYVCTSMRVYEVINPQHVCAARVTVVAVSVCLLVC